MQQEWEERAAIMEYDGHASSGDAEHMAKSCTQDAGIVLRPYQQDAFTAALAALERGGHPVINAATGSGKSALIAALAARLPGRILVVTHRKKLLSQNSAQLTRYLGKEKDIGVYSAGLDRRDMHHRVIFGGVQSIYRRMDALQEAGAFRYLIIDENHLCPPPDEDSMYKGVFQACPGAQRIGLSATPSRMGIPVYGANRWFDQCVCTIGIKQLTPEYLAPLIELQHATDIDLSAIRKKAGEFVMADAGQVFSEEKVAQAALQEITLLAEKRKKWALFCCDIAHTKLVASLLNDLRIPCGSMTSDQNIDENDAALAAFEQSKTRALASCIMMTTGFDIPDIDCIVLLRPTMSKELLIQMLGRGTRKAPGKDNCLILDYAGNLERHTPLDEIAEKQKSAARQKKDAEKEEKEAIEKEERERKAKHKKSLFEKEEEITLRVNRVTYKVVPSKKQMGKNLLQVIYVCQNGRYVSQWLCLEYPRRSWAYRQAAAWFIRRSRQVPETAMLGISVAQSAKPPQSISVVKVGQWDKITMEYWD
jgi:DNA repair protein RadD